MKIVVPLAEGFEEIEGVTIIDVLRRAGLDVTTAHVGSNPVKGSHGISVTADRPLSELKAVDFNCIVLPGGMPGSENLRKSDTVISFIKHIFSKGGITAAVCAAPIVLARAGVLYGKRATCFPGYEAECEGATMTGAPVEHDGTVITGCGAGCALPFALEVAGALAGEAVKKELIGRMRVYWME
ncbi:MAG: DJ-1/PfpI family protein [Spirochaetes bacterium]|nr:MAG: DJ-1/PfpI family protein [Spirochaetota bacterium]